MIHERSLNTQPSSANRAADQVVRDPWGLSGYDHGPLNLGIERTEVVTARNHFEVFYEEFNCGILFIPESVTLDPDDGSTATVDALLEAMEGWSAKGSAPFVVIAPDGPADPWPPTWPIDETIARLDAAGQGGWRLIYTDRPTDG